MKRKLLICLALLVFLAAVGAAEMRTYDYGGSERDWINGMAVAQDGRIAVTGYTESSDGTLSDRTKTWRAGWVMMLDAQMNVMWNYCSRSGDADHIRLPVFHEDGTLTVVHETEGKQMKIVRLDREGNEVASKTIWTEAENPAIWFWNAGIMENGYLFRKTEQGNPSEGILYDWDGNVLLRGEEWGKATAVGGRHVILEDEEGFCLYAVDETGQKKKLALAYERGQDGSVSRRYNCLVSLADGGAAACGSIWEGPQTSESAEQGLISRWDAQGNLVFEMIITLGERCDVMLSRMVQTENGFAATGYEMWTQTEWRLFNFDEQGILTNTFELDAAESRNNIAPVALRKDGALIAMQQIGEDDKEDVRVTVAEK